MIKKSLLNFFLILFVCFSSLQAQDTVRVMQYNLLYYGYNIFDCNATSNNVNKKNAALREIIDYVKPDIFTVNEISKYVSFHDQILDSVLNINGVSCFARAGLTNFSNTVILNQLYYNTDKFGLKNQYALLGGDRDINVYKLYYKSPDLVWSGDTVFITIFVAHLATSNNSVGQANRDNEAAIVMNHIATLPNPHNYLFQGDFNMYSGSEPGFQRLINNSNANIRFHDPINKVGEWSVNSTYAAYHTQSTHTSGDCFIGGGLDDRFDFILASLPIIMETQGVKYVPGSYTTLGQDGLHFNKALIDSPTNNSAPANIIQALYNMSDHLPVYLDLKINQTPAGVEYIAGQSFGVTFNNPVFDECVLNIKTQADGNFRISLFDITGRCVRNTNVDVFGGSAQITLDLSSLSAGLYFLNVSSVRQQSVSFRLIKL